MTLSSWETTSVDGVITGGTRTVTVTNVLDEPIEGLVVPLDPTPCDCNIVSLQTDTGTIDGFSWIVGTLQPGETRTLTLGYELASSRGVAAWLPSPITLGLLLLSVLAFGTASIAIRKHSGSVGFDFPG
jgi:hypothetical protein